MDFRVVYARTGETARIHIDDSTRSGRAGPLRRRHRAASRGSSRSHASLRSELQVAFGVPMRSQMLLIGPPYVHFTSKEPLHSQLVRHATPRRAGAALRWRPTRRSIPSPFRASQAGRSTIVLFDKQHLQGVAPDLGKLVEPHIDPALLGATRRPHAESSRRVSQTPHQTSATPGERTA